MIKVLLADDQALVRGAVAAMLNLEPDLTVVAEAGTGAEALSAARHFAPDVALLDVQMPGNGLDVAATMRTALPRIRVVICTTFGRPGYLTRAMAAGAVGFVVKDTPPEQLVATIRRVHAGHRVVDPSLAAESLVAGPSPLTAREREALAAVHAHGTIADAAKRLFLSQGTIRNHLSAAIRKTGTRTSAEAVRLSEERGWL